MKIIVGLYSRSSTINNLADELSIPDKRLTDEAQDLAARRPLPGGPAQVCPSHVHCMENTGQWLFLDLSMPVVLILVTI